MENNKEIKIAIIVGLIMVTCCIIAFIFYKASTRVENIDVKVYKSHVIDATENKREYRECVITTDILLAINKEYKRAMRLNDDQRVIGKQINGTYKLISGDTYIAFDFDEDTPYVYRGDTKKMYYFKSDIYKQVAEVCTK